MVCFGFPLHVVHIESIAPDMLPYHPLSRKQVQFDSLCHVVPKSHPNAFHVAFCGMVVIEKVQLRGLSFLSQRKVVILPDVQGLSFSHVVHKVEIVPWKRPSPRT